MKKLIEHWERIYATKNKEQVSWTQEVPTTSLGFIHSFNLAKDSSIIDVGGGESKLVDFLLDEGFTNITVLDISAKALVKTQARLGERAARVKWIVSDVTEFKPDHEYDVWHDRATFHFLTTKNQVEKYISLASRSLSKKGFLTIGTFSDAGPDKCSGLDVKQYSESDLEHILRTAFQKIRCLTEDHITPFKTIQNFLFCSFRKAA
jgi:ubiquinone/menaquinone biosynthesis C-methylase UbiE